MKRILLANLLLLGYAFTSMTFAQSRTVTGKVTSAEDGQAVPGVNVILEGTSTGTNTDMDGNFRVTVPDGDAVLVFRFVGLAQTKEVVGSRSIINVEMQPDVKQLGEVVISAYGVDQKRDLTGSVASVKGDVIQDLPMQSFDRAIQGRVAGTQIGAASGQPGGALNIRIRGISSINSGNDPLIIIDGVQVASAGQTTQGSANPLNAINPNDIESIDILKDAAAAAIYGAQAANGVILVTTKSGGGGDGKKSQINFSMQEGFVQPFNLYDVMDGNQYAEFRAEQELNVGLDPAREGGAYQFYGNPATDTVANYDWLDAMFQNGRLRTYDLSMSGGDDKTQFFIGGSYNLQEGQIIMSDWERITGRMNVTHKPTDKLTFSTKLALTHNRTFGSIENGNFVNGPFIGAFASWPTSPAVDENGNYNRYPTNPLLSHLFNYNILEGVNEEVRLGRTLQTVSSANLTYQILPSLSATAYVGIDFSMNKDENNRPSTIPVFAPAGGSVFTNNRRSINVNTSYTLNYNKTFGDVHNVRGILGYEYKYEEREGNSFTVNSFANPFFRVPSDGLFTGTPGGFFQDYKRLGVFGKVDYTYDDKYLVNFTLRRDGHSRFGAQNRYGTFYAGSVGWRITEESFMSGVSVINDLKLRASYGVLGNSEIGNYETLNQFGNTTGAYQGAPTVTITQLGNDQITWEEEESINLGFDFAILENRIYGSVDFWRTNNNELLFDVPFFENAGIITNRNAQAAEIVNNIGSMRNQGIDIEVSGVPVDIPSAGFRWDVSFNISFLQNEVTELPEAVGDTLFDGDFPELIVGQPVDFFWLLPFAGVNPANGRAMVRDQAGNLLYNTTVDQGQVVGSAIPSSFGGFTNVFSFKGITLEAFFQFQLGNEAFNGDLYNLLDNGGADNSRVDNYENRWRQPGDLTNYPQWTTNGNIEGIDQEFGFIGTTRYMSDGGYARLKQLTISYDFPQSLLSRVNINNLRIYAQAINLLTWTKYDGIDPEVVANNNLTGESSFGVYPLGRTFSAGLNIGL